MTWGEVAAIAFLVVLVTFVLRGIRGHERSGHTFETMDGTSGDAD